MVTGLEAPELDASSPLEGVADDLWALGVTPDGTAVGLARGHLDRLGVIPAAQLGQATPGRVLVAGAVTHRQAPETARGAVFLNLEDETGHVNVIFSKGAWVRWKHVARSSPALVVAGRLEAAQGVITVVAERVEALDLGAPTISSRDLR